MEQESCNFPLFISMKGKRVYVYGGGTIALRRVNLLTEFQAEVRVTAPEISEELMELVRVGKIRYEKRVYVPGELAQDGAPGPFLVLAATNDNGVNDQIAAECRLCHIPVNHAGDHEQNDFYFPAVIRAEGLTIGLTGSGKNHKKVKQAAAWIRNHTAELLAAAEKQEK